MRRLLAALAATGLLAVLVGCGLPTDSSPRALDPAAAPFPPRVVPEQPVDGDGRVALYFVRDDRVVLVRRPVSASTSVEELVELLLAGPTGEEREAGRRTAIPTGLRVDDVTVLPPGPDGVAVVTLGGPADVVSAAGLPLAIAQFVFTLTPNVARGVRFRYDGADLPVPIGDGSLTAAAVSRDDYIDLLATPPPTAPEATEEPPPTEEPDPAPAPPASPAG